MKKNLFAILLMATFSFAVTSCGEQKSGDAQSEETKSGKSKVADLSFDDYSKEELTKKIAALADECSTPLECMTLFADALEKCNDNKQKDAVEDGIRLSKYDKIDPQSINEEDLKRLRERIDKAYERIHNK